MGIRLKGLKRTVRRHGGVRGHRAGPHGRELLPYEAARRLIYLPSYRWVLEHRVGDLVTELRTISAERDVVLLDYTTNGDVADLSTPLSHAALIALNLDDSWPAAARTAAQPPVATAAATQQPLETAAVSWPSAASTTTLSGPAR